MLFLILLEAVFCVILFVVRKNEKEDDSFSTSGEIGNVDSSGLEDVPSGSDGSDNQTDDKQPVSDEAADSEDLISAASVATRILGFVNAPTLQQKVVKRCLNEKTDISYYESVWLTLFFVVIQLAMVLLISIRLYKKDTRK